MFEDQLRTVEQLADVVPMVQILDIPVPQMADQLVASLLHLDSPIPSRLSQSTLVDVIDVHILVPRSSPGFGGLQGLHPGQSSAAVSEQNVDIPAPRGLQSFHSDQGSAAFFQILMETHSKGFSPLFAGGKKRCAGRLAPGSQLGADSSSSTPASRLDDFWEDEAGGLWMRLPSGRWKLLCADVYVRWDDPG